MKQDAEEDDGQDAADPKSKKPDDAGEVTANVALGLPEDESDDKFGAPRCQGQGHRCMEPDDGASFGPIIGWNQMFFF